MSQNYQRVSLTRLEQQQHQHHVRKSKEEQVPLVQDGVPLDQLDPSYYTGIPNTAPPSFKSVASSRHEHAGTPPAPDDDDNADSMEDPGISLWGGSSVDSASIRETAFAQLLNRVERLESRLEEQPLASKEFDINAAIAKRRKEFWVALASTVGAVIVIAWIMAVVLLSVWARIEVARHSGQLKDNSM
ncbi:hypothetical protein PVAG01_00437 [Phlyctema vagabunda]|uniref:Uncharacterized protein n=1 Tax=Phlyctema vagabunda TaxID=108571 RepID=A0ABR4PU92_9HELO